MPITLRSQKGSALTYAELDGNFTFISGSYLEISQTSSISVTTSSYAISSSFANSSSYALTSSYSVTSSFVISSPTGSKKDYASFGTFNTNMSDLSGSTGNRHIPPGYLTYYVGCNELFNDKSSLILYPLTTNGTNRRDPLHSSPITIINEGGYSAWITRNQRDFGYIAKTSTSDLFTSCSLAQYSYITLFVDEFSFPMGWRILDSGSLY